MADADEFDGRLTVTPAGGEGRAVTLDVWAARAVFARLTVEHPDLLARTDRWCAWLVGRGLPALSHGAALRVADRLLAAADEFQARNRGPALADARLARFYGFSVAGLSAAEKLALESAMRVIEAEEELAAGVESDQRFFDLVRLATGSEDRAQKATTKRLAQKLRNNIQSEFYR